MKHLFVYAKYKQKFVLDEQNLASFIKQMQGKKVAICGAIQFLDSIKGIKEQLEAEGFIVSILQGEHSFEKGQVLGCDTPQLDVSSYDGMLYIGDGVFHPKGMRITNDLKIFTFDPFAGKLDVFDGELMTDLKRKHKAAVSKFLFHEHIGVIVSLKSGQNRYVLVDKLKQKFPDKKYYVIVFDTLNYTEMENFPFVDVWVNTMCPRIALNDTNKIQKPICNIIDLLELA